MKKISAAIFAVLCFSCLIQAKSITVTSPKAIDVWQTGHSYAITWTSVGITSNVNIRLRQGDTRIEIVNVTPNNGSYLWNIPANIAPGSYYIRVNTVNGDFFGVSANFTISSMQVISPKHTEPPPLIKLKFPRLEVSDIDLTPNTEGFGIIFSYKNVGEGALPKASEVPVKPNYRVLIDGKETARGSLFIPAFAAQPGWQQAGYFGGLIVLPNNEYAFNNHWHIGNMITVHINENRVLGMNSHSLTLRLKPIALNYKFDLVRNGISLNWDTRTLTVSLRLDGNVPAGRELLVYCGIAPASDNYFMFRKHATPGTYVVSRKLDFITIADSQVSIYLNSYVTIPDVMHVFDMDYRNNGTIYLKFTRPNPNPVQ